MMQWLCSRKRHLLARQLTMLKSISILLFVWNQVKGHGASLHDLMLASSSLVLLADYGT
jgi:hypothetical protein